MAKMMTITMIALLMGSPLAAKSHQWQRGTLENIQTSQSVQTIMNMPVGGVAPTTNQFGTMPGIPPSYVPINELVTSEQLTIDLDGIRYVAQWSRHLTGVIIHDPITIAIEGSRLYIKFAKGEGKLTISSAERLP